MLYAEPAVSGAPAAGEPTNARTVTATAGRTHSLSLVILVPLCRPAAVREKERGTVGGWSVGGAALTPPERGAGRDGPRGYDHRPSGGRPVLVPTAFPKYP